MRAYLTIAILLLPLYAYAQVYKWVGSNGQMHYSDRPMNGSEPVRVPGHRSAPASDKAVSDEESKTAPGSYSAVEILRPEPNQTLRDADAKVELSLLIDPPLSEEHSVHVLLDGQTVPGDIRQTQVLLQDLAYGSHRLQLQILDDRDVTIASSPPVDFHLRKPVP